MWYSMLRILFNLQLLKSSKGMGHRDRFPDPPPTIHKARITGIGS